jgi:hypothetical protein
MKKLIALLLLSTVIISGGCRKQSVASGTPKCIRHKIESDRNTIGRVEEYEFQGKVVYAFQPDANVIADGATTVVTTDCNTLCSVGGFGGPSVNLCNGENFFQKAVLKKTVWKK